MGVVLAVDRPEPGNRTQVMSPVVALLLPPLLENDLVRVDIALRPLILHLVIQEDRLIDMRFVLRRRGFRFGRLLCGRLVGRSRGRYAL